LNLGDLRGKTIEVIPGGEGDNLEFLGEGLNNLEGARPNRARRA